MDRSIVIEMRRKTGIETVDRFRRGEREGREIYNKVLSGTGRRAVLLLNRNASAATITVRFADLGLGATASVRNVWLGMDLGSKTTSYGASVPAHDSVLLLVTEAAAQ